MKFGVREVANIVFKAKSKGKLGGHEYESGEPVIYFDSAKTSTVESASTTVYAQGGRGNPNIMAWEGDKTATLTFEEALLSPLGFSILSGANVVDSKRISFHETTQVEAREILFDTESAGITGDSVTAIKLDLDRIGTGSLIKTKDRAHIYVMKIVDGEIVGRVKVLREGETGKGLAIIHKSTNEDGRLYTESFYLADGVLEGAEIKKSAEPLLEAGATYLLDFYTERDGTEMTVSADKFAGYYYIEADTLFRRASDGKDIPAQFVIPKGKVQSNFTFTMAGSGDPSTFTFTVDAMPDYTTFDTTCKVLFALNVADDPVVEGACS